MRRNKKYAVVAFILVGIFIFAACGRGDSAEDDGGFWGGGELLVGSAWNGDANDSWYTAEAEAWDGAWDVEPPAAMATPGSPDFREVAAATERQIIQSASVELETEEFDEAVAALREIAPALDGFVESEMLTTRGRQIFTIVIRVPAAQFENALSRVENLADVRHLNQRAQDVTDRFYNLAANLETRQIEEERILALIDDAVEIHDILALETRLSSTRLTIETYLAQLTVMAGQISYSTITATLFDIADTPIVVVADTLGERIGGAFGDSVDSTVRGFQNFVVFLAGAIIPLAIFGAIGFGVFMIFRRVRKKIPL